MAAPFLLVIVLAPLWMASIVATIVLTVLLARSASSAPATDDTPLGTARAASRQARRHAGLTAALAAVAPVAVVFLVGLAALVVARPLWPAGVALVGVVPAAASITFLAVHVYGERRRPRDRGVVRTASLTQLVPEDIAPAGLRRWLVVVLGIATVAIAVPAAFSLPLASTTPERAAVVVTFGALLAVAVATVLASHHVLRVVAERPATSGVDAGWDADLRRLAAHRVLRGTQMLVGLVGAVSLVGSAFAGAVLLAGPGLLLLVVVAVVALVPGPVPRDAAPADDAGTPTSTGADEPEARSDVVEPSGALGSAEDPV